MKPAVWTRREEGARERMDDPHCDLARLQRTYAQFATVNAVLAGWRTVYCRELRPHLSQGEPVTLLDVGCGGGDVPRRLARWAQRDGLPLKVTAIDPDERAIAYARSRSAPANLEFQPLSTGDLLAQGQQFDFVTSNHVLHHLNEDELAALLRDSGQLARRKVIHSDLVRSRAAYLLFNVFARPVFRQSFIVEDGLTSIRRSFTADELRCAVPPGWTVQHARPFRLLLTYDHPSN